MFINSLNSISQNFKGMIVIPNGVDGPKHAFNTDNIASIHEQPSDKGSHRTDIYTTDGCKTSVPVTFNEVLDTYALASTDKKSVLSVRG